MDKEPKKPQDQEEDIQNVSLAEYTPTNRSDLWYCEL